METRVYTTAVRRGILPPILSAGGQFTLAHSDEPDGDNQNHPIILPRHTCMVLHGHKSYMYSKWNHRYLRWNEGGVSDLGKR